MKRLWATLLALFPVVLVSGAGAAGWQEYSLANIPSGAPIHGWQQVAFWCDTPGRVLAVTPLAKGVATATGPTTLAQWVGGKLTTQQYQLGPVDAGAGQVYTALTPAGQTPGETPKSFIHSSNVENVQDPAYRMTHVNEFRVPAGNFQCRYVPQAAVLAATARHTIIVWERGKNVTYASRNRDGTPGVQLSGGQHTRNAQGQEKYVWTRNGYSYVLEVGNPDHAGHLGGSLNVWKGGRQLSREALLAYSISTPR